MTAALYAKSLFDRLLAGGEAELDAVLRSGEPETDYIDFKQVATSQAGLQARKLVKQDSSNLGKAISGFHNLDGGIIVWGIECDWTADPSTRTCAPGLDDPDTLTGVLRDRIAAATRHAVSGIEFEKVQLRNGKHAVLMLVPPRSGGMPVESQLGRPGYYFRAGESFLRVPPDLLAHMFGSNPPARCSVRLTCEAGSRPSPRAGALTLQVNMYVANRGRGMAFHVYANLVWDKPGPNAGVKMATPNGLFTKIGTPEGTGVLVGGPDFRLPPGAEVLLGRLDIELKPPIRSDLRIRVHSGSEHDLPTAGEWIIAMDAITTAVEKAKGNVTFKALWSQMLAHSGSSSPEDR